MATTDTLDRLESQVETLKTRLGQTESALKAMTRERDQAVAARSIDAAARAAGVAPAAVDDVVNRALASGEWQKDAKGRLVRHVGGYPDIDNNGNILTAENFVASLRESASFYWADTGQGSGGNRVPGTDPNAKNPWMKDTWCDMAQAAAYRADPEKATAMAKAAGSFIGALRPA